LLPLGCAGIGLMLLSGVVRWRHKQRQTRIEEVLIAPDSLVGAK